MNDYRVWSAFLVLLVRVAWAVLPEPVAPTPPVANTAAPIVAPARVIQTDPKTSEIYLAPLE